MHDTLFPFLGISFQKTGAGQPEIEKNNEYEGWKNKKHNILKALQLEESHTPPFLKSLAPANKGINNDGGTGQQP